MYGKEQITVPIEVPVWDQAHDTLDKMSEDMRSRANEIEHHQARLAGELDAIRTVLSRISPAPPRPIAGFGAALNSPSQPYR